MMTFLQINGGILWLLLLVQLFPFTSSLESEEKLLFKMYPFFVDEVFAFVIERVQDTPDSVDSAPNDYDLNLYPFGSPDALLLSFGDEADRDSLLTQNPTFLHESMKQSQCYCSRTLQLSLIYVDMFLGGRNNILPSCQNYVLMEDNATGLYHMDIFDQDIARKVFQLLDQDVSRFINFYFIPIGYPQRHLLDEFNAHNFIDNIPISFSEKHLHNSSESCANNPYLASAVEKLFIDLLFSVFMLPQCPYTSTYCCFLQLHQFSDIAESSRCSYHPHWVSPASKIIAKSPDIMLLNTSYPVVDVLQESMTGKFFYLEEKVIAMQRKGSDIGVSHQQGTVEKYFGNSTSKEFSFDDPSTVLQADNSCLFFPSVGLNEYVDFGTNPIPSFRNLYIHDPAPPDVVGHAHFSVLDASGAYFQNGELFVHFAASTLHDNIGFRTLRGRYESTLTMYFESSSYGLGLNDSKSLSPPLRVHAIVSPLETLLNNESVSTSMIKLPDMSFIASSSDDVIITTPDTPCRCDQLSSGIHFLLGVVHNPYFGHVLTNTLSNLFAALHLRRINPQDVTLHIHLERVGHFQEWEDKYSALFYALGIKEMTVNNNDEMLISSSRWRSNDVFCLERVIVGTEPLLDNLNRTVDIATGRLASLPLWKMFGNTVANAVLPTEVKKLFIDPIPWKTRKAIVPLSANACAVTFIARHRHVDALHSRGIRNLEELEGVAREQGCTSQVLFLHKMTLVDQIAQLRFNTTLLVGADGTGLLNAVWMHECTSVLRINLWRKRGIVNKLNQGQWFEYIPTHKETVLYPRHLTFDPEGMYPTEEEIELERYIRSHGTLLNEVMDREYAEFDGGSRSHFNFSGAVHGLSDVMVEDFFREAQSTIVLPDKFKEILLQSEEFRQTCMSSLYDYL